MIAHLFGLVCLALIDWTAAGCAGDYNCKYNERCFSDSNTCEVAENVNHQEGVKCYLDSYCKSQYKCENWACYFKGKTYEHLSDTKDVKGACTHDDECPDDYYCRMDRHTCYKRSSSFKETECQPDSWCKDNYHCCHDQKCENHQCVAAPASEGRHIKDVTCSYNFHCPSEYTCKNYTCYYSGEEHAHFPYNVEKPVTCTYDYDCPSGFYCHEDYSTCYHSKTRSARSLDCVSRDTCQYHYQCCGHQRCIGSQCRDKAPDEDNHQSQDHWCRYDLDCASEYVCDASQFTCIYKGPEYAHLPYTYKTQNNLSVRCDKNADCPGSGYYCKNGTYTCYDVATQNGNAYSYSSQSADHIVLLAKK